jgi:predicted nucleic acid-binding protein
VIVVDTSVLAEVLSKARYTDQLSAHGDLHAPQLCDLELASTLGRLLRTGLVDKRRLGEILADYVELPLTLHGHRPLLGRCTGLRANFSAYDAAYVALAERLRAPFFTLDRALARAVERHVPTIELVA